MWDESLIIIMQMQNFRTKGGKFENVISTHVHYHVMFKIFSFLCSNADKRVYQIPACTEVVALWELAGVHKISKESQV